MKLTKQHISHISIFLIFVFSIFALFKLTQTFLRLTFFHILPFCRAFTPTFFTSFTHILGLIIFASLFLFTTTLFSILTFSYIKTRKQLNTLHDSSVDISDPQLLSILHKHQLPTDLFIVSSITSREAFTLGFFSPKIVLSTDFIQKLSIDELEAVILHELYHLRNNHPLLITLTQIVTSHLFFIPIVKDITKAIKINFEKQADAFVVNSQTTSHHLQSALSALTQYTDKSKLHRKAYTSNTSNIKLSLLFSFIVLFLTFFASKTHAHQTYTSNSKFCQSQTHTISMK